MRPLIFMLIHIGRRHNLDIPSSILYLVSLNPIKHQASPINFMFNIHLSPTVFKKILVYYRNNIEVVKEIFEICWLKIP